MVINYVAIADVRWNPEKGLSKDRYRRMRGIYAIKKHFKKRPYKLFSELQTDGYSFSENCHYEDTHEEVTILDDVDLKLDYFVKNAGLTEDQRQYIDMYRRGYKPMEIARMYNASVDKVYSRIYDGIKKMRRIAKWQTSCTN